MTDTNPRTKGTHMTATIELPVTQAGNTASTDSARPLLRLENVEKVFYTDEVETHALSGVHLDIGAASSSRSPGLGLRQVELLSILALDTQPYGVTVSRNRCEPERADRARIRNRETFSYSELQPDRDSRRRNASSRSPTADWRRPSARRVSAALERVRWRTAEAPAEPSRAASSSASRWSARSRRVILSRTSRPGTSIPQLRVGDELAARPAQRTRSAW